jgi:histidine triad (HIT) family protein
MAACIFCEIIAGHKPGRIVYQDDALVAIEDIHPRTPVHLLIMPRRHVPTLLDLAPEDAVWMGAIPFVANQLAHAHGIAESGYRLVVNVNHGGGQVIFHVHYHLMGGRPLRWPP